MDILREVCKDLLLSLFFSKSTKEIFFDIINP